MNWKRCYHLSSYTGVRQTDRQTDSLVEITVKCSHSKAHAAVWCRSDIYSAAMETVQSPTGGQGSLWRTDRQVSCGGVRWMDGGQTTERER